MAIFDNLIAETNEMDAALFSRTTVGQASEIYLLTPAAAKFAHLLGGEWKVATDPLTEIWEVVVDPRGAAARLGVTIGTAG